MSQFEDRSFSELAVRIDRGRCIGSGNCTKLAPEVFELDETSIVRFKDQAPDIGRARLIEACEVCPVDALIIFDSQGEQIVPAS